MNTCDFTGWLTEKPKLQETESHSFAYFQLRVKRRHAREKLKYSYPTFKVWDKQADYICNSAEAGDFIVIQNAEYLKEPYMKNDKKEYFEYFQVETCEVIKLVPKEERTQNTEDDPV